MDLSLSLSYITGLVTVEGLNLYNNLEKKQHVDVSFNIIHGCRMSSYTSSPSEVNRAVYGYLLIQALHCQ